MPTKRTSLKWVKCPHCGEPFGSLAKHEKYCTSRPVESIISGIQREIDKLKQQLEYYTNLKEFNSRTKRR